MSNLFVQFGDAILRKVARNETAEAACSGYYQYRCNTTVCETGSHRWQKRYCYQQTTNCHTACTSWANVGCCV